MTHLQDLMLTKIARSDYTTINNKEPTTLDEVGAVWADVIIEDAEDKGVFTSLLNSGHVLYNRYKDKRDNTVELTQAGFDAYKQIK